MLLIHRINLSKEPNSGNDNDANEGAFRVPWFPGEKGKLTYQEARLPVFDPWTLEEYADELSRSGVRVLARKRGTMWVRYERFAYVRFPTFQLGSPTPGETARLLWRGPGLVVSYMIEPDQRHPANAWLYLCTNRNYSLESLDSAMRRNVRKGLKELKIAPISSGQLVASGFEAFRDTRHRAGLTDGTLEAFQRRFSAFKEGPGRCLLGAWKEAELAAFLSIIEVEDWVEIESCSVDRFLHHRPNDVLFFTAMTQYMSDPRCRLVSYGVSSIQEESNTAGLHRFKTKVGFEAIPVHRVFVVHPLLRPLVNRPILWIMSGARHFLPGNRALRKACGMLRLLIYGGGKLGESVPDTASPLPDD